jgi:hypothetical protein
MKMTKREKELSKQLEVAVNALDDLSKGSCLTDENLQLWAKTVSVLIPLLVEKIRKTIS